jgi:hypothetical protein
LGYFHLKNNKEGFRNRGDNTNIVFSDNYQKILGRSWKKDYFDRFTSSDQSPYSINSILDINKQIREGKLKNNYPWFIKSYNIIFNESGIHPEPMRNHKIKLWTVKKKLKPRSKTQLLEGTMGILADDDNRHKSIQYYENLQILINNKFIPLLKKIGNSQFDSIMSTKVNMTRKNGTPYMGSLNSIF